MTSPRPILCCLLLIAMAGGSFFSVRAQPADPVDPGAKPGDAPAEPIDPVQVAIDKLNALENGLTIDREKSCVDVKAKVCLRVGEFLEMFACTKDTREHESILVLDAMPSTMHLAMLLLGQEPGKPLSYDMKQSPPKLIPATGPKVRIVIVREIAGQMRETPANRWIKDNKSGEMMKDNIWLFAGSQQTQFNGKPVYLADVNGSAISLVNFGDDLLTLPNDLTDKNDSHDKVWAPRTQAIPEVGTEVVVRLYVQAPKRDAGEDADAPQKPAAEADTETKTEPEPPAQP